MSDTFEGTGTDGTREGGPARQGDEVSDEVRLDLDESKLDTWDEVRGDYALDPESEMTRPALTEQEEDDDDDETPPREDEEEDDLAEDDEDGRADEEE
ncbi:hypothetical protein GCM10022415_03120 [Knoellia locipacati]|uniref:Uncharacterized protein n=1 Tax=Knoellia locipacati TaxID=882824 RepID=A0A512SWG1_9MICO|nr:hypothetical protein [Knoellia locipacati]GEQ12264.1 hypothetical protein KLO01_03110 [Knoellia locipacati]